MTLVYRTADEPVHQGTELLRHVLEDGIGRHDLRLPPADRHPETRLDLVDLGAVRALDTRVALHDGPTCLLLRRAQDVSGDESPAYRIDIPVHGSLGVSQDGRDVRARPGTLVLTDLSRPAGWLLDAQRMTTLLVPRTLLGVGADGVATLTATPLTGELARLVSSLAHLAFRAEPVGRADATRLGSALVDLISVTLASHLGGPEDLGGDTPRRALLTRIYAFVEERLGDPDLTPRAVAAAHHISVRYLFRLFEGDGHTPAAWIRRRRLEHAHRDLLDPRLRDRPVGAIGARWGFTNPAHFNRAFKAQFGTSPGELRNR